jgi:hypothetical protein
MHILVVAAMSAIIKGEDDVIIAFSYLTKFAQDFPKGISVRREGELAVRRIKARKLLTWLNEHGYTDVSVEQLKKQREAFSKFESSFSEIKLDDDQQIPDNAQHQQSNKEVHGIH